MALGEKFYAIVLAGTEQLRKRYRLTQAAKDDWSIRFENDRVFLEFTCDHRDHSVMAHLGLRAKHPEISEFFTDIEIRQFYGMQPSTITPGSNGRFPISPQVQEIASMLHDKCQLLFAGDVMEFTRLNRFATDLRANYTRKASAAYPPSPRRQHTTLYVFWFLLFGALAAAIVAFKLWERLPAIVQAP